MHSPGSPPDPAGSGLHLRVGGLPGSLEPTRQRVHDFLAGHLSAKALYRVETVIEEVLMNFVMHAHDDSALHEVDLHVGLHPQTVQITFEDDGRPFDPTAAAVPPPGTLDEARPGGLGLVLVRKSALGLRYERRLDRNRLAVDIGRV